MVATPGDRRAQYEQALGLNRKLEQIIQDNIKEYDSFTMFMRQWAKRSFQQGAGLKVEDWKKKAEDMSARLQAALASGPALLPSQPPTSPRTPATWIRWSLSLPNKRLTPAAGSRSRTSWR